MKNTRLWIAAPMLLVTVLTGCQAHKPANDPLEPINRQVYYFNKTVDKTIYRPMAVAYNRAVPSSIKQCVTHFFDNLYAPLTLINDLLQGKIRYALHDLTRMIVNSTVGIGGLFDVASQLHIAKRENDFGITLAYYSKNKNPQSPYIMLPFLGPSTLRDLLAMPLNLVTNPLYYVNDTRLSMTLTGVYYTSLRARLLPIDSVLDQPFNQYEAFKNAYLQHREYAVKHHLEQADYHADAHFDAGYHYFSHEKVNQSNQVNEAPGDDFSIDGPADTAQTTAKKNND